MYTWNIQLVDNFTKIKNQESVHVEPKSGIAFFPFFLRIF